VGIRTPYLASFPSQLKLTTVLLVGRITSLPYLTPIANHSVSWTKKISVNYANSITAHHVFVNFLIKTLLAFYRIKRVFPSIFSRSISSELPVCDRCFLIVTREENQRKFTEKWRDNYETVEPLIRLYVELRVIREEVSKGIIGNETIV
jgi:hypothetical protein